MLRSRLTGALWWTAVRLGLCLANVGDAELARLRFRSLRWIVLAAGTTACLVVLAGGLAAIPGPPAVPAVPGAPGAPGAAAGATAAGAAGGAAAPGRAAVSGRPPARRSPGRTLALAAYAAAALMAVAALAVWQWSRTIGRRAVRDRAGYPVPCRGTVRGLIAGREGGWPLLVQSERGRWLWLTGSGDALAPLHRRLAGRARARSWRMSVTVTYYPQCRVIHQVTGMAVEELEEVLATSRAYGASPA